jgi:hypothetical protein
MIPRAHITAWRRNAPWSTDAQVEQDLVLSRVLVEIYSDPVLSSSLAFRGGTALHKLFLAPAARYSAALEKRKAAARKARSLRPLTDAAIWDHLESKVTIGIHPLLVDESCGLLAV